MSAPTTAEVAKAPESVASTPDTRVVHKPRILGGVRGKFAKLATVGVLAATSLGLAGDVARTPKDNTLPPITSFGLTVFSDIQSGKAQIEYPAVTTDVLKTEFTELAETNPKIRDVSEAFGKCIDPDKSAFMWQAAQLENCGAVATALAAEAQGTGNQDAAKKLTGDFVGWALGSQGPQLIKTSDGLNRFATSFAVLPAWVGKKVQW